MASKIHYVHQQLTTNARIFSVKAEYSTLTVN